MTAVESEEAMAIALSEAGWIVSPPNKQGQDEKLELLRYRARGALRDYADGEFTQDILVRELANDVLLLAFEVERWRAAYTPEIVELEDSRARIAQVDESLGSMEKLFLTLAEEASETRRRLHGSVG